jgi:chromosome partitioning protein
MPQDTRILAVANRKGGTGKSTTVVNVAAEMARRGLQVLVVDLDPQGHAGLGFGISARPGDVTVHKAFRDRSIVLSDGIRRGCEPGVDILPADLDFDGLIHISDPRHLARVLAPLLPAYDVVLIDTPPASPQLLVLALMTADAVLVPTLLEYLSLDGVRQFIRAYHAIISGYNLALAGLLVVPMRVDLRSGMQKTVLDKMLTGFGRHQMATGVRIDTAVPEAFGRNQPLNRYRPKARAAADFARLTDDVLQHFPVRRRPTRQAG